MATPFLKTKIHIPKVRGELVHRPRLTEELTKNIASKLILISAPAGFGKTTLLAEWMQNLRRSVAWISLDLGDNDITRFLAYIISALQKINENFGISILEMLHSTERIPIV